MDFAGSGDSGFVCPHKHDMWGTSAACEKRERTDGANRRSAASCRAQEPVEVSLGMYLTNLVSIDESRETFEVGGYLMAKWNDPRLRFRQKVVGPRPILRMRSASFVKTSYSVSHRVSHRARTSSLQADANGDVTVTEAHKTRCRVADSTCRRRTWGVQIKEWRKLPGSGTPYGFVLRTG